MEKLLTISILSVIFTSCGSSKNNSELNNAQTENILTCSDDLKYDFHEIKIYEQNLELQLEGNRPNNIIIHSAERIIRSANKFIE